MNRNNTERRSARECSEALALLSRTERKRTATLEEGRARDTALRRLSAWRKCYPNGIPGEGLYHDGIPDAPAYAPATEPSPPGKSR